jgi:16S rRNA (adenine1518-N6/adenine1519-N6)-dimethyltransferase
MSDGNHPFGRDLIQPSKRLGQNFLHDKNIVRKIVSALAPTPTETIVEIGPGTGALTRELVEKAGRVVAIEFDRQLVPLLNKAFSANDNFQLLNEDALKVEFCEAILPAASARLVANLPYNISTAILQKLIRQRSCISEMVVMLQLEVVERILAPAGSSERGYLSVLVEAYCDGEKLFDVSPGAFKPQPKVWSSVVRLRLKTDSVLTRINEELLWATVSAGFAQKRKTILNNLRNASGVLQEVIQKNGGASIVLCKAEVELQRRAETLTVAEWVRIVAAMQ